MLNHPWAVCGRQPVLFLFSGNPRNSLSLTRRVCLFVQLEALFDRAFRNQSFA